MKTKKMALEAEFGAETRFEVQPRPDAFERLKERLLAIRLGEIGSKWEDSLRDAAAEAAALAWTTMIPSLVFPVLFEEKIAAAVTQNRRQASILQKSRELLAA